MSNISYFKRNKYHNKSCRCRAGHSHQSVLEANYCDELALMVKAGAIKGYRSQVRYGLDVNGIHICDHIVDFVVENNEGVEYVAEVKGFATEVWNLKHKLFKAIYPGIEYHVIAAGNRIFAFNGESEKDLLACYFNYCKEKNVKPLRVEFGCVYVKNDKLGKSSATRLLKGVIERGQV